MPSYSHRPTKLMNDISHKVEKEVKLHTVTTYLQDAVMSAPAHGTNKRDSEVAYDV